MRRLPRTLSTLLLLLPALAPLPAQMSSVPAEIHWGPEYNQPSGTQVAKIVGIVPEGFYVLRYKNIEKTNARPRVYLEFFDRDMKLVRANELELKYKGKQRDFEDVLFLGGRLYLLTSFNNQAKKKNYLFRQEISRRSLLPSRTLHMIAETEARNKEREGTFDFFISRDSSKLLIYNQLPYKRNDPERFSLRVYDAAFELLWTKDIALPYPDNQFSVEEYRVDRAGNVYLLGVLYQDQARARRRGAPNYQYVILAYMDGGERVEEFRLDLQGKFITDLTFRVGNDGNLLCTGFYSEKGTYSIKGTYFFRLDTRSREIYNRNLREFDFDFLTYALNPREKEKARDAEREGKRRNQPELYRYRLDDLILRSDGGAVLIAEQFFVYERSDRYYSYYDYYYPSPFYYDPYYRRTIYYNYNDIIVVNIRPDGEIEWTAVIPKRQSTIDDGGYFSSYAMAVVRDRIFFVYNDNARNLDPARAGDGRIYNYDGRNSVIALAEVRKDGQVLIHPLFPNRDADVITRPKVCKQIGRRQMAIFGERGRSFRFARLDFQ